MARRIVWQPQKTFNSASLSSSYQAMTDASSVAGLVNPCRQFFIQNLSSVSVQVSFDGINDAFPLVSSGFYVSDISTNNLNSPSDEGPMLQQGTIVYLKQVTAAGTGSIYFSCWNESGD